jgi:predicted phosphodiesterase
MRIAIISDIHGNDIAFAAVMADLQAQAAIHPIDQIVCNGDAIQGGPQPGQVAERLHGLACPVVMGNADAFVLTGQDEEDATTPPERLRMLQAVREWTWAQLDASQRDFIRGFQPTVRLDLNAGQSLLCFHGSPSSFNHIILPRTPDDEVMGYLGDHADSILTGGHTHLQQIRPIHNSIFFNPGSVGLAFSHQTHRQLFAWAEYAILTVEGPTRGLEFRRVPFDVEALIHVYETSGRPYADDMIRQYRAG